MKRVTITLPLPVAVRLKEAAKKEHRSVSKFACVNLERILDGKPEPGKVVPFHRRATARV